MIEIVADSGTETTGQAGGPSLAATMPVESRHRIILPRRSGEFWFAPRQYCYSASKSGVVSSLPLTASVSKRDEGSDVQGEGA